MTFRMTRTALKALPYDFVRAVEEHRAALLAHRFSGDAAPTADSVVEQALRRVRREGEPDDFVVDYEVIEDVVPPSAVEQRQSLLAALRQAEVSARDAVIGAGRLRRLGLDVSRILARPESDRTTDDRSVLASYAAVQARLERIQYHAAIQEEALETLPAVELAGWHWEPFPA